MAGTIMIAKNNMMGTSTLEFDYLVERIRAAFPVEYKSIASAVYEPLDEGGMTFISAIDLDQESYCVFSDAVHRAYKDSMREASFPLHESRWIDLLGIVENDPRSRESKAKGR
ncbi:hypothetical protein [Burkholderia sp. Ac-20379]